MDAMLLQLFQLSQVSNKLFAGKHVSKSFNKKTQTHRFCDGSDKSREGFCVIQFFANDMLI